MTKNSPQRSRGILKYISEVWLRYRKEEWASYAALGIYSMGVSKSSLRVPLWSVEKNWGFWVISHLILT